MSALCGLMRGLTIGSQCRTTIAAAKQVKPLLGAVCNVFNLDQTRPLTMKQVRRIRGYPRPLRAGIVRPEPMKYGYRLPKGPQYTTDPLRIIKLAGRDPNTGRVVVRTIGGGLQKWAYWVDFTRDGPEEGCLEERVYKIEEDGIQTARVALVANGDKKRWIVATEGVQVGDIIKTTREIPRIPVRPKVGDAHPLGALPVGTMVHCIEKHPKNEAYYCRSAGAHAEIQRKINGRVVIVLPSKLQVSLSEKCLAVVGQVSNADRMETFYPIGSPNRLRRLGKRPRTGWWHRKDGYCGRKIKKTPPVKVVPLVQPIPTSHYIL